jgi:hypothetical protein
MKPCSSRSSSSMSSSRTFLRPISGIALLSSLWLGATSVAAQPSAPKPKANGAQSPAVAPAPLAPVSTPARAEAKPAAAKPAEAKPAAAKPVAAKPAEPKPAETTAKPPVAKPVEPKIAEEVPTPVGAEPGVSEAPLAADGQPAASKAAAVPAPVATDTKAKAEPPKPEAPAQPLSSMLQLHLGVTTVWNKDLGYDYFSEDDVGQRIGLLAGLDALHLNDALVLVLELGFSGEEEHGGFVPPELVSDATLSAAHLFGGVVVRDDLTQWLSLHAGVHGGASFNDVTLSVADDDQKLKAESTTPFVGLGAGFSLMTRPTRLDSERKAFNSMAMGCRFEGGYVMSSRLSLGFEDRAVDVPEQRIRVEGAELGSIDRSGAYLDISAFVRL